MQNISFEQLIIRQSSKLLASNPEKFLSTWKLLALDALKWFDIDRLTIFPNSMISMNKGGTISISCDLSPIIDMDIFKKHSHFPDYLNLLKIKKNVISFNQKELEFSKLSVLRLLYMQGGKSHVIIPVRLFSQVWGAVSFTQFNKNGLITAHSLEQLKLLCEIWLCYWQHSILCNSLNQNNFNDGEKLLKLTKKQFSILSLITQGYTAKQCAETLHLSPRTIESHKYRILDVLELDNHSELIQFSLRNGLGIK